MESRSLAMEIVRHLREAGHVAFWVGGCVRDRMMGKEPEDYDIVTSARPEEMERLFRHTVPVGRQFGVMLVVLEGESFQVATFRAEAGYQDGRRPDEVRFASAQEDASRRDFTVNGLFYDPLEDRLYDWVGGEADLKAGLIRTIGSPERRFSEDHLRLLRAVRFAAQLGFEIESETFKALTASAEAICRVSAERIREELSRLFRPPQAARGLELLRESSLLGWILPEVGQTEGCEQSPDYHPEGSVYEHIRRMLSLLPIDSDPLLPWAVMLHDIGKPSTQEHDPRTGTIHFYGHEKVGAEMTADILRRLRFSRREIETVRSCVAHHMQFKDVQAMRKATLRRLLARPTYPLELELHRLDCLGSHGRLDNYDFLVEFQRELHEQPPEPAPLIRGRDLLAMGMPSGPRLGALLKEVREKQLQDEIVTREAALDWVKQRLRER